MKWFYRMRLGQINSLVFVALMLLVLFIFTALAHVRQGFDIPKPGVYAVCIGGTVCMSLLNCWSYSNSIDGKHSIRMKVYLNHDELCCRYREQRIWSCKWDEIHHLEKRNNTHRCRSVYVYLDEEEISPFFFEYSLSAKKALFEFCPRKELLDQIKRE